MWRGNGYGCVVAQARSKCVFIWNKSSRKATKTTIGLSFGKRLICKLAAAPTAKPAATTTTNYEYCTLLDSEEGRKEKGERCVQGKGDNFLGGQSGFKCVKVKFITPESKKKNNQRNEIRARLGRRRGGRRDSCRAALASLQHVCVSACVWDRLSNDQVELISSFSSSQLNA